MNEHIETSVLDVFITTHCTLKCKMCYNRIPYVKKHEHFPVENIKQEVKAIFEILDYTKAFCYMGGEILLHLDLPELIRFVAPFSKHIGVFRIATNGTLIPGDSVVQALLDIRKSMPIEIMLSDYGKLSTKKAELTELCGKHNIPLRVDKYYGDEQYFGGWIDTGDFSLRNYSDEQLDEIWSTCAEIVHKYVVIYKGKVVACSRLISGVNAGYTEFPDFVMDLHEDSLSLNQRRNKLIVLRDESKDYCKYCGGYNTKTAVRFSAAEQL